MCPWGGRNLLRLVGVGEVAFEGVLKSADVVERVVADAVSLLHHLAEHVGVLAYVVAHHEEGSLHAILLQQPEYPGGDFGDGAVVEGEVDGPFVGIHPPQRSGIQLPEQRGGLFNQHSRVCVFIPSFPCRGCISRLPWACRCRPRATGIASSLSPRRRATPSCIPVRRRRA